MSRRHAEEAQRVAPPRDPPDPGVMPSALTFFVSVRDRSRVLRVLRTFGDERGPALLRALGLEQDGPPRVDRGGRGRAGD